MRYRRGMTRRRLLQLGASAAGGLAAAWLLPGDQGQRAREQIAAAQSSAPAPKYHLAGTDGWIGLPNPPARPPYHPDSLAPAPFTTYMFGFVNVTGMSDTQVAAMKNRAQAPAPLMYFDEGQEYTVRLTNLGLAMRPDLTDAHTIHWHGFRNAIPMFDGEPSSSVAVPIGRTLSYYYRPREEGTYMYHCHVEDTEHVHMGMTGVLFVRPTQNNGAPGIPAGRYAYNDGVAPSNARSTAYDREYAMILSEVWLEAHWADAHIQLPDWTDYRADFCLLNGRTYPDTTLPDGDPLSTAAGTLQYQPRSSLITANAGERVLLRLANLGFTPQSMTLDGIRMRVVGKDATLLRGRDSTDLSYQATTVSIGPGESVDVIFIAPNVTTTTTYLFYSRNYMHLNNAGAPGYGGPMTEVRISPAGTLPPQNPEL